MSETKKKSALDWLLQIIGIITTVLLAVFIIWGVWSQTFTNTDKLKAFVVQFGIWGPVVLTILTLLQVVVPVLPGGIGLLPATLLYGPFWGFVINYVGVVVGSIMAFILARIYGKRLMNKFFSPKMWEKYEHYLSYQKQFDRIFAVSIFLPIAPDDFLCYLAGTTKMDFKKFVIIILLGKPAALLFYTYSLNKGFNWIFK